MLHNPNGLYIHIGGGGVRRMAESGHLIALAEITLVNLLLSGDNAVVIAMAAKRLPTRQRRLAVWWGTAAAVMLRIGLTLGAAVVLRVPYMQSIGAALLCVVALQLLRGERGGAPSRSSATLAGAVWAIVVADLVMGFDNVLAVAAIARGDAWLLFAGVAMSVPIMIWGSAALMTLLDRAPWLMYAGGGLLGYTAGEMLMSDPAWRPWLLAQPERLAAAFPFLVVALLVGGALWWSRRA